MAKWTPPLLACGFGIWSDWLELIYPHESTGLTLGSVRADSKSLIVSEDVTTDPLIHVRVTVVCHNICCCEETNGLSAMWTQTTVDWFTFAGKAMYLVLIIQFIIRYQRYSTIDKKFTILHPKDKQMNLSLNPFHTLWIVAMPINCLEKQYTIDFFTVYSYNDTVCWMYKPPWFLHTMFKLWCFFKFSLTYQVLL